MRALALVLRRLVWFPPTLLGLLAVTFVISRVIPADPVALVAGETATPAQVAALRSQLGFDRPLAVQFVDYVGRLVRGDLGTSLYTTRPIADDLASRLAATIELTLVAMALSVLVGIPLGVVSALWRNSVLDHALRVITVSGLAIASFWLAIILARKNCARSITAYKTSLGTMRWRSSSICTKQCVGFLFPAFR